MVWMENMKIKIVNMWEVNVIVFYVLLNMN